MILSSVWVSAQEARSRRRAGFTLVELLVAVGIFLILASLAFGAFNAATDGDRGPAAVQSLRAWIEGAKSRAAKLGRPVGIRPIISSSNFDGHAVAQFEYVANVEPIEGTLAYIEELVWDNGSGIQIRQWRVGQRVSQPDAFTSPPFDPVPWSQLNGDAVGEVAVLGPGARIEIPRDSGNWFFVASDDPRTAGYQEFGPANGGSGLENNYLTIVGRPANLTFVSGGAGFLSAGANDANIESTSNSFNEHSVPGPAGGFTPDASAVRWLYSDYVDSGGGFTLSLFEGIPYRLELGQDVLEEERKLGLPGGMLVDLDASTTPAVGFPDDTGVNGNGNGSSFDDPYGPRPLMFSATGEVVGDYQSLGAITFYIANREELTLARALTGHPSNAAENAAMPFPYELWDRTTPPVRSEAIGDPQAVTVFPKTGFAQTSIINPTDTDADGFANNPFEFRLRGDLAE